MTDDLHVAHGFTLGDLHAMAVAACSADRSLASDARTRYDTAWSAIADALAVADGDDPPARTDLVRTGWQAIYAEVREMRHTFGFKDRDGTTGVATAPRYVTYWTVRHHDPEDGFIERLAVRQILPTLPGLYRDAVMALAVHGNYQDAADALGIGYTAFVARIRTARRRLHALWFAPETAPPVRGTDRRGAAYGKAPATHCSSGHEWTPENTRMSSSWRGAGHAKVRRCRTCEAERSKARRGAEAA
ncbi:hypothetical protein ABZ953_06615 [Streptomyces sp. NPDC046465]|uniref:hypothetical protein n=1 Tax=Streptomyces sp. NPDC046465 TaxID=3155810 RepID=UPI00340BD5AF